MKVKYGMYLIALGITFAAKVSAHDHHNSVAYETSNGVVVDTYHRHHVSERVYYNDAWYHPTHVYVYDGYNYPVYYGDYPYYYYDPRWYWEY